MPVFAPDSLIFGHFAVIVLKDMAIMAMRKEIY